MTCGRLQRQILSIQIQINVFLYKFKVKQYVNCFFFKTLLIMFDFHLHQRLLSFVENGPKLKKTKKSFSKENLELCKYIRK